MNGVLLISEKYIKENSNINDNVFGSWLLPSIREAQEMYLEPVLGNCLYNKILYLVSENLINEPENYDYKVLLDDFIQPFLLYQVLCNIIPILNVKLANLGSVTTNDEHTTNLTQGESDLIKNYYQERSDFYIGKMQKYLKDNLSLYPEIEECGCGEGANFESSTNSVGLWLGGFRGRKILK